MFRQVREVPEGQCLLNRGVQKGSASSTQAFLWRGSIQQQGFAHAKILTNCVSGLA